MLKAMLKYTVHYTKLILLYVVIYMRHVEQMMITAVD